MALVRKNPGDPIGAADANNQFVDLLTGVTALGIDIQGTIRATSQGGPSSGAGLEVAYSGGSGFLSAYDRSGAVYKQLVLNGLLNIYPSGGVFLGASPSDPGASGALWIASRIRVGANAQDLGAGSVVAGAGVYGGTASANYVALTGAGAGSGAVVAALGTDTNVDLQLTPQGAGLIHIAYAATAGNTTTQAGNKLSIRVNGTQRYLQLYSA